MAIYRVRTTKGLSDIIEGTGGEVGLFRQSEKDRDSGGKFVKKYNNRPFPGSLQVMAPMWDKAREKWQFECTEEQWADVIKDLGLLYLKGHPKEGLEIEPRTLSYHKNNQNSPIFNHDDLYGFSGLVIEGGETSLNDERAKDRFFLYMLRGDRNVHDTSINADLPRHPGTTLEIFVPNREQVKKSRKVDILDSAFEAKLKLKGDQERLYQISVLLNFNEVGAESTATESYSVLTNRIIEQGNVPQTGTPYQTMNHALVAYEAMDLETLRQHFLVALGKRHNKIVIVRGGFMLMDSKIEGPQTLEEIRDYMFSGSDEISQKVYDMIKYFETQGLF